MMKRYAVLFIIMLLVTGITAGQERETRNLSGFNRIGFGISGNLTIKIGSQFSVALEGNKRDLEMVETEISGDKLIIRHSNWRYRFDERVNVYITLPELEGLSVSGSGKAEIVDDIKNADDLELSVSGSGKLYTAGIVADDIECSISGSGDIIINSAGSVDEGEISISGSGSYKGGEMEIDHLSVRVSGSGNCYCKVGDSLQASISGSGDVTYIGNPKIDARVSGSGKVRSAM